MAWSLSVLALGLALVAWRAGIQDSWRRSPFDRAHTLIPPGDGSPPAGPGTPPATTAQGKPRPLAVHRRAGRPAPPALPRAWLGSPVSSQDG